MKQRYLIFSLVGAVISATTILSILQSPYASVPSYETRTDAPLNYSGRDVNGIKGAIDEIYSKKLNQITNDIPMEAYFAALDQNQTLKASSAFKAVALDWKELGPDNIGGRTRAILFDKNDPDLVFAGSVSGGLFRSTTGGLSWKPVNDAQENLAVTAIDQASDGTIYYGTGEGIAYQGGSGGSSILGAGIFKSTDKGVTFTRIPSTFETASAPLRSAFSLINALVVNPTNDNNILVATNSGIRYSTDAGTTWLSAGGSAASGNCKDLVINTNGVAIANLGSGVQISTDGGATWTGPSGPPAPLGGRIELAFSPTDPNIAYAVAVNTGTGALTNVLRSEDAGTTWTIIGPGGGSFNPTGYQGWYDIALGVSHANPNVIYFGGQTEGWTWQNGGWAPVATGFGGTGSPNYIHPDHHSTATHPSNPNKMLIGTDGGIFSSSNITDALPTFNSLNRGYSVTQYYAVYPTLNGGAIGGTQDNGTHYLKGGGFTGKNGSSINGGDGFYTAVSSINPKAFFMSSQYGFIVRSSNEGQGGSLFFDENFTTAAFGNSSRINCASFYTNFRLWENMQDSSSMFVAGFSNCSGGGQVWVTAGALNFAKTPQWFQVAKGVAGTVERIEISDDGNHIYVATSSNRVYRIDGVKEGITKGYIASDNDTSTNVKLDSTIISTTLVYNGGSRAITGLGVDDNNPARVLVTLGNYGNSTFIMKSENATSASPTFTSIQGNLPQFPVYDALFDNANPTTIVAGTEYGIFTSDDNGATWAAANGGGFPNVAVFMLVQQKKNLPNATNRSVVYAATHGRGIWRTESLASSVAPKNIEKFPIDLKMYPNPAKDNASLEFILNSAGSVEIEIYDIQGKRVSVQNLGNFAAGNQKSSFNVSELKSGSYVLRVKSNGLSNTTKFIVKR